MKREINRLIVMRCVENKPWLTSSQIAEEIRSAGIQGIDYREVNRRLNEIDSIYRGPKIKCPINNRHEYVWLSKREFGKSQQKQRPSR